MRMPPPGPVIRMVGMRNWSECIESNEWKTVKFKQITIVLGISDV